MLNRLRINTRLVVSFLLVAAIPVGFVTTINYIATKDALVTQMLSGLRAITDSRAAHMLTLFRLRQEQAIELAGTHRLRQLDPYGLQPGAIVSDIQSELDAVLQEMKLARGEESKDKGSPTAIEAIGVWSVDGTIIASTDRRVIGRRMPDRFLEGVKEKGSYFGGYIKDPLTGGNFLLLLEEIRHAETGRFSGAIFF